jgi:poly(A) polymerase
VRFVGDPRQRIEEDVLRLLRFFRFHAHYGKPPPDEAALAACRELAPKLPGLSGERVQAELLKLLAARDPATVVALMRDQEVLKHLLPEASAIDRLAGLVRVETKPDPVRRLAALLIDGEGAARRVGERLKLSNADRDRLLQLAGPSDLTPGLDLRQRRLQLYQLGDALYRDRVYLGWAVAPRSEADLWKQLLAVADQPVPEFPIKGRDALGLGLEAGPEVGRLLAAVERWWIEGDFQADRKACLKQLKELAGRAG